MTFEQSVGYLYSLGNEVETMKLGLDNIRRLLAALGDPQNNYLKVQVAGTNGKGSVCAFLYSICLSASINTGTFTSPHLISITERIRINGRDIDEADFAVYASKVRETAEKMLESGELEYLPTFFEQITAIAMVAFAEAGVELAILETGLGGRLDATTAANAEIAAITRIDYDHQEYLGDTIEEIAAEKAAIIGPNTKNVVIGDQMPDAMSVIEEHVRQLVGNAGRGECTHEAFSSFRAPSLPVGFLPVSLGLAGVHQAENARVAVGIAKLLKKYFPIRDEHIRLGLKNARHAGRLEYAGKYLFDGAHNIGGTRALAAYIDEFVDKPIMIIFAAMKGKDIGSMAEILFPKAGTIILTRPENSRALSASELAAIVPSNFERKHPILTENVAEAVKKAESVAGDGIILVTGSLYLVGEVKKILRSQI